MSTETMERPVAAAPVAALTPPQRAAVALNTAEYEIKLRELLTNSVGILTVTNKAGRDECHSAYMVLKNTRCGITNLAEDATEDAKKFTKAVKAEATRLIAITTAEEDRLLSLRDGWDEAEQARKDALIAAERARTKAIQFEISVIAREPLNHIDSNSAKLAEAIAAFEAVVIDDFYAEFTAEAEAALAATLAKLRDLHAKELAAERAVAAAEEARIAEVARIEAESAELAKQRAENERIANEQAAERQRLADLAAAQALAAKGLADKAAANLKADRDAQELAMKIEREKVEAAQAKAQAEIKAAQDALASSQAAHQAAIKKQAETEQRNADHASALIENMERDAAKFAADQDEAMIDNAAFDAARADDLVRCAATAQAMLTNGRSLVQPDADPVRASLDAYADAGLDDSEAPYIDYEAIAWAYKKLLAFGVGNGSTDNALMLDRLNLMLMTAEAA